MPILAPRFSDLRLFLAALVRRAPVERLDLGQAGASATTPDRNQPETGALVCPAFCCETRSVTSRGDRDRSLHDAIDSNESEGHLNIELAAAPVHCASQGLTSLKLQDAICHGVIEPAPVRRAKMARHDQVKTLTSASAAQNPNSAAEARFHRAILPDWSAKITASAT